MDIKWFLIDTLLMVAFGLKHTLGTTKVAVNAFNKLFPAQLWNIVYSTISIIFLLVIYIFWQSSGVVIYSFSGIEKAMILALMGFNLFMFFYCFKFTTSFWQWLGIQQLIRTIKKEPLDSYYRIRKNGLKRYIRFPHHTFLILIFWCQPTMTLDTLWLAIFATIYTYIGTVHQDSRGRRLLGDEWIQYSEKTNLLVPNFIKMGKDFISKVSQNTDVIKY